MDRRRNIFGGKSEIEAMTVMRELSWFSVDKWVTKTFTSIWASVAILVYTFRGHGGASSGKAGIDI